MQYLCMLLVAFVVALPTASCAKAPPNLSPAGAHDFNATSVVKGADAFMDVVTVAADQTPPLIRRAIADKVVDYHHVVISTVDASGVTKLGTLRAGLDAIIAALTLDEARILTPYLSLMKAIIAGVQ